MIEAKEKDIIEFPSNACDDKLVIRIRSISPEMKSNVES